MIKSIDYDCMMTMFVTVCVFLYVRTNKDFCSALFPENVQKFPDTPKNAERIFIEGQENVKTKKKELYMMCWRICCCSLFRNCKKKTT